MTQTNENTASAGRTVHNLIIVDESGSMQSIYRSALTGMNETLATIREAQEEHPEQRQLVTLATFDERNANASPYDPISRPQIGRHTHYRMAQALHYNEIYHNTPASETGEVTRKQYRPYGATPLYDAMGRGIGELRPYVEKGDVVLVTIITDGMENASKEFSHEAIRELVDELKGQGWVFTYIGANQDVDRVGYSLNIENVMDFEASPEGTAEMFEAERACRKEFYSRVAVVAPDGVINEDAYFRSRPKTKKKSGGSEKKSGGSGNIGFIPF